MCSSSIVKLYITHVGRCDKHFQHVIRQLISNINESLMRVVQWKQLAYFFFWKVNRTKYYKSREDID